VDRQSFVLLPGFGRGGGEVAERKGTDGTKELRISRILCLTSIAEYCDSPFISMALGYLNIYSWSR